MAEEREAPARARAAPGPAAWAEIVSSTLLIVTTVAILVTGFVLRSGPLHEQPADAGALPPATAAPAGTAPEAPPLSEPAVAPVEQAPPPIEPPPAPVRKAASVTPVPADPHLAGLADRALAYADRIRRASGSWTAQVVVACKAETVSRCVSSAKGSPKLYVLPTELNGSSCFRVCWGAYATAKDAAACRDLPPGLRSAGPVRSVEIAKVLP